MKSLNEGYSTMAKFTQTITVRCPRCASSLAMRLLMAGDNEGGTPIQVAAGNGHAETVRALRQAGAQG